MKCCAVCGSQFEPPRVDAKYCSERCRNRRPRKVRPWRDRRRAIRACEVCSETYEVTWSGQRTCGRICGAKINAASRRVSLKRRKSKWSDPGPVSRVWFPDCLHCGRAFAARSAKVMLCSDECRAARRAEYDSDYNRTRRTEFRRCADCGDQISPQRRKCDSCRVESARETRRRAKRRRRARKRGAISEPYTLAQIAARDRNRCGLCGKRVAMTQQVPHPRAPVIDHVVPLADHGDDTRANVQLAHFLCNSIKSAGGSQQLALVG